MSRPKTSNRTGRKPGKPGRPRKTKDNLRAKRLRLRVSESELALLEEQAEGRPLTSLIRERLFGAPIRRLPVVPAANRQIFGQLAKIGNNVNQLVHLTHTGRFPSRLETLLIELYQMIAKYQRDLLGVPE
jgi:hypothetical protein